MINNFFLTTASTNVIYDSESSVGFFNFPESISGETFDQTIFVSLVDDMGQTVFSSSSGFKLKI